MHPLETAAASSPEPRTLWASDEAGPALLAGPACPFKPQLILKQVLLTVLWGEPPPGQKLPEASQLGLITEPLWVRHSVDTVEPTHLPRDTSTRE